MNNKEQVVEEQIRGIAECNKKDCKGCASCDYYYAITRFCEDKIALTKEELNDLEYKAYARGVNSFAEKVNNLFNRDIKDSVVYTQTEKDILKEFVESIYEIARNL